MNQIFIYRNETGVETVSEKSVAEGICSTRLQTKILPSRPWNLLVTKGYVSRTLTSHPRLADQMQL